MLHFQSSGSDLVPARYEIQCEDEGTTLILNIRAELWPHVLSRLRNWAYLPYLERDLQVPHFISPHGLPWGFGPVLMEEKSADSQWHRIRCELPQFFRGTFVHEGDPWGKAFGLSASLWAVLSLASYEVPDVNLSPELVQIVEVMIGARRNNMGSSCATAAAFSPQLCTWIAAQDLDRLCCHLTQQMTNAYLRLYGLDEVDSFGRHELGARVIEFPYILFSCPGDRCSLYRSVGTNWRYGQGYELMDHNVDTPMQQLVLLMGVAALTTAYRNSQ
ncbi:MAG: hypothetical protein WEC84_00655 [Candidatus Andersenbacteria bacterium]